MTAIRLMAWIAQSLGRPIARGVLHPICLYFLLASGSASHAIGQYRERLFGRPVTWRDFYRHYLALVLGVIEHGGTIDAPLGRHPVHRTKMAVVRSGGREARTHYLVRERFANTTLLECQLETGRTHQIRVHFASRGNPLAGDPVYGKTCSGDARIDTFKRQALHAWRLALVHPVSKRDVSWESPLPDDFAQLLEDLRGDASGQLSGKSDGEIRHK